MCGCSGSKDSNKRPDKYDIDILNGYMIVDIVIKGIIAIAVLIYVGYALAGAI